MDFDLKAQMIQSAKEMGIILSPEVAAQFMKYKDLLFEWNQKMNLTAITDDWEIIQKHFLDSLSVISSAGLLNQELKAIDVGTGPGFPGLPLKIVLDKLDMTLLDSTKKKLGFIDMVIGELGVTGVHTFHSRAEDGGNNPAHREAYDLCFSRAVASLDVLCEFCLPFVKPGGKFIALKGPKAHEEMDQSKNAIKILGGAVDGMKTTVIPGTDLSHTIIIIAKTGQTPPRFPRKPGVVRENPIK